jgi:hypothetical protein
MNSVLKIAGVVAAAFLAVLLAFWLAQSMVVMIVPTAVAVFAALLMHRVQIGGWRSLLLLCLVLPWAAVAGIEIRMSAMPSAHHAALYEGGLPIVLLVVALLLPLACSLFMFAALRGLRASAE